MPSIAPRSIAVAIAALALAAAAGSARAASDTYTVNSLVSDGGTRNNSNSKVASAGAGQLADVIA
jgi:hypothetical protein